MIWLSRRVSALDRTGIDFLQVMAIFFAVSEYIRHFTDCQSAPTPLPSSAWYTRAVATPAADLRRRVLGWRAAEHREREVRANEPPPTPAEALEAAFELHDLFAGTPAPLDVVRIREIAEARAAWRIVRQRLTCRPDAIR
jgi:hypothetical protein